MRNSLSPSLSLSTATVTGQIYGAPYADLSQCGVALVNSRTRKPVVPAGDPPVNPDGSYSIANVAPGEWQLFCLPPASLALAAMTYRQVPGLLSPESGTLYLEAAQTYVADIILPPAAQLTVSVVTASGTPVNGAYALVYSPTVPSFAALPAQTDTNGMTYLVNVPLTAKLALVPPSLNTFQWVDQAGGLSTGPFKTAPSVTLPAQGDASTVISVFLR